MKNKENYNTKFWNSKVYSRNQLHIIFKEGIMPHFIVCLLLSGYILFRFSLIEGIICLLFSVIFSWFINKRVGMI